MRRQSLFMLVNGILLIVPVITWLMGLLDLRQMGFATPTFFSFALGILLGASCIPLSYYPTRFVILKRNIEIPWIEKPRISFKRMIPFLLVGAIVEELFFRGFLVSLVLPLGLVWVVMISSFAHYFGHFLNPGFRLIENTADKMLAASGWFLTAIMLTVLFIYSKSLIPVVIAHSFASIGFGWMMTARREGRVPR